MLTVRGEGAKTGQTRHVPLNSEAVEVLKAWRPAAYEASWCVFGGCRFVNAARGDQEGSGQVY
jgi:integrase